MQQILEIKNEEVTPDLLLDLQRMVTDGTLDNPSGAGRFRRSDEEIVVGDELGEVFHVPPPAQELGRRLEAMCDFA